MRHRQAGRKLGRTMAHREMMMRNLVTSLVLYEKIITTAAKAKDLRGVAEKMVTLAKREDLHARRQAAEVLTDDKALKKLFETIGARYRERNGGYTRITKLDYRMGDGAPLAAIEFLGFEPGDLLNRQTGQGVAFSPRPGTIDAVVLGEAFQGTGDIARLRFQARKAGAPTLGFGDVLARVYELWWSGDSAAARALHRRVLPLINLESHPFMRYILRRRGVIASTVERGTAPPLTADQRARLHAAPLVVVRGGGQAAGDVAPVEVHDGVRGMERVLVGESGWMVGRKRLPVLER